MLKGICGEVMHVIDVELFMSELLRCSQNHFGLNEPYQKLSEIEVQIMCLLLEVDRSILLLFIFHFVTPRPRREYSTTTVGAYKSSKCHIVVFWRLK